MKDQEHSTLAGTTQILADGSGSAPRRVHLFDVAELNAIEAALRTKRALLLRGEPGVGKSQLAEAYAQARGWKLFPKTLDANTDPDDLKWYEDAVERLAEAQFAGSKADTRSHPEIQEALARQNFVKKGPLWQAFEHDGPSVVLIDEIDKADMSVPNALLEALGSGQFQPPAGLPLVTAKQWPLVILTTNEERPLPPAFLRRCLVHSMDPPKAREDMRDWLVARGQAVHETVESAALEKVADTLLNEREVAEKQGYEPLPGLAEYLDLLRIVFAEDAGDLESELKQFSQFVLNKTRT